MIKSNQVNGTNPLAYTQQITFSLTSNLVYKFNNVKEVLN